MSDITRDDLIVRIMSKPVSYGKGMSLKPAALGLRPVTPADLVSVFRSDPDLLAEVLEGLGAELLWLEPETRVHLRGTVWSGPPNFGDARGGGVVFVLRVDRGGQE